MYDLQTFEDEVNAHGGFECVVGLWFNNSNVELFPDGFDPAINIDRDRESILIYHKDIKKIPILTIRKLAYLEGISFVTNKEDAPYVSMQSVRF